MPDESANAIEITASARTTGKTDEEMDAHLRTIWSRRADRYSELRNEDTIGIEKVEMSRIGG